MKVSFIGLGVMGYPIASHLSKNGHLVKVYNRTFSRAKKWADKHKMSAATSPAEAAKDAEIIFICINTDADIKEVVCGENSILDSAKKGSVIVDLSTASASLAVELASICQKQDVYFLDAPVSGGQQGAEEGKLAVMVGGEHSGLALAKPAIKCFAKQIVHIGKAGSGQYAKMVNQICIAGVLQGLAEGLNFAKEVGLDIDKLLKVITQGAASSWQMENRGKTMNQGKFDFGFAVDLMRKDLAIALKAANQINAELPVTALIDQFYKKLQAQNNGKLDTSSLIKLL